MFYSLVIWFAIMQISTSVLRTMGVVALKLSAKIPWVAIRVPVDWDIQETAKPVEVS